MIPIQQPLYSMEELDQSSLHPLLETNICLGLNRTRVTGVAGEHSSKELFKQLVYLLLGITICAGIFTLRDFLPATWLPPVYVFIEDMYSQGLDSLFTDNRNTQRDLKQSRRGHHYGGT